MFEIIVTLKPMSLSRLRFYTKAFQSFIIKYLVYNSFVFKDSKLVKNCSWGETFKILIGRCVLVSILLQIFTVLVTQNKNITRVNT